MQALIVYFSKFGNTRRVAEAIAETISQAGGTHHVVTIDQLTPSDFEGADLVIMGTPTHGFNVPEVVRSRLGTLPPGILRGKSVAAFDTTVRPWPLRHLRAAPKLLRQLTRLGGKPVARPQTFFVQMHSTQGTGEHDLLLAGQIERARDWAREILKQSRA